MEARGGEQRLDTRSRGPALGREVARVVAQPERDARRLSRGEGEQQVPGLEVCGGGHVDEGQARRGREARVDARELGAIDLGLGALPEPEATQPELRRPREERDQRAPRRGGEAHPHRAQHAVQRGEPLVEPSADEQPLRRAPAQLLRGLRLGP